MGAGGPRRDCHSTQASYGVRLPLPNLSRSPSPFPRDSWPGPCLSRPQPWPACLRGEGLCPWKDRTVGPGPGRT